VTLPGHAASADDDNDPFTGGRGDGSQASSTGVVTVGAESEYLPVNSEGSTGSGCTDESSTDIAINDDFATPLTAGYYLIDPVQTTKAKVETFTFTAARNAASSSTRLFSPTGRWFRYNCGGDYYLLPEGGPAVSIDGLIQRAIRRIDPPTPPLAVTPQHGKHAVRIPSWLAIEPAYWRQERTATVRAGRVEVTATMTPTTVEWDMGNGDIEVCDNPGVIWRSYMKESTSTCGYTYTAPSINPPDHTYQLASTVSFDVTHQTNAPGTYGPWVPVERSATQTIRVVEIQSVSS
jgi:hypothetical protein